MRKGGIIPSEGERAFIVGSTGSGKSAFSAWLLQQVPFTPFVIYDTKEDDKFPKLPGSIIVRNDDDALEAVDNPEYDFIIYRPSVEMSANPEELDELLLTHYYKFSRVGAYIDEAYQFHRSGRAYAGLIALLTRGRSRGITTIVSSQRPSMLSRFALTEAQHLYVFQLSDAQDKKRIADIVTDFNKERDPDEFGFHYYNVKSRRLSRHPKIILDKSFAGEYIQEQKPENPLDGNTTSLKRRLFI